MRQQRRQRGPGGQGSPEDCVNKSPKAHVPIGNFVFTCGDFGKFLLVFGVLKFHGGKSHA